MLVLAVQTESGRQVFVYWTARLIEFAGIGAIGLGLVLTTIIFTLRLMKEGWSAGAYHEYRSHLGRSILLGLEFLVAADIINTVSIDPTLKSAAVLGVIVLIRTFLSFSLEVEINGHWPWEDTKLKRESR